jgi:hypothetical protein
LKAHNGRSQQRHQRNQGRQQQRGPRESNSPEGLRSTEWLRGTTSWTFLGSHPWTTLLAEDFFQGNLETWKKRCGQDLMLPQGDLRDFSVILQPIDFDLRSIGIDQP